MENVIEVEPENLILNGLNIGIVESGKEASATITGEAPMQVLNLVLPRGEQGKSAYQVAVDNGFAGTEQEWLESFKKYVDEQIGNINTTGATYIQDSAINLYEYEQGIYRAGNIFIYFQPGSGARYKGANYIFLIDIGDKKGATILNYIVDGSYINVEVSYYIFDASKTYYSGNYNPKKVLKSDNSVSYGVINDYNPAHKLYVDTAIQEAVGDINVILATLTTPSEVA